MSLQDEVAAARKEIKSDGYDMSLGEIINLYKDDELKIDPEYQRLFRWDQTRKTRFIESLLLGIPVPPIFVFQDRSGVWELIDGLQRMSTIFQLVGILRDEGKERLVLEGTNYLPSLAGKAWKGLPNDPDSALDKSLQIQIKRARMRVEILQPESDPTAKFELFQRLNTGGAGLTQQEVRNCVAVMIDKSFFAWLNSLASDTHFFHTTAQTETALEGQMGVELALRLLAFAHVPYDKNLDVHEYLDNSLITLATSEDFDRDAEGKRFRDTFGFLDEALGDSAFKRWDGVAFKGKFLMSVFEVMAYGVYANVEALRSLDAAEREIVLQNKAKSLWQNKTFEKYSGAGVRGSTRLVNLLPMAPEFLSVED